MLYTRHLGMPRGLPIAGPGPGHLRGGRLHLAALAILLGGDNQELSDGTMQVSTPGQAADLIDQLRTAGITLTYDPDTRTIGTDARDIVAVTVGQDR